MKKVTDMKAKRRTQNQRKNLNKNNTVVNAGTLDRVSTLFTKCGAGSPKRFIVASSQKIKQIAIITMLTLISQGQFSFLLDLKRNQLKLYLFPLVPPNFSN